MLAKVHKSPNGVIIAICDRELIDKKFVDGKLQLDLTSNFYKGQEFSEADLLDLCKKAYLINLVGEKSLDFALKNKLMDKEKVLRIKGIPIYQTMIVRE